MRILTFFSLTAYIILLVWVAIHEQHHDHEKVISRDSNYENQTVVDTNYTLAQKSEKSPLSSRGCKYRD